MAKKQNLYYVDWYTAGGFCYHTSTDCTWQQVLDCRRVAKALGDRIEYSKMNY